MPERRRCPRSRLFRNAFKQQRCLILADGFYEWKREGMTKHPYYIRFKDGRILRLQVVGPVGETGPGTGPVIPCRGSWLLVREIPAAYSRVWRITRCQKSRKGSGISWHLTCSHLPLCVYLTEASPEVEMSSAPAFLKIVLARSVSSEFSECTDIRILPSFNLLS